MPGMPPDTTQQLFEPTAQGPRGGGQPAQGYNNGFNGDFSGIFYSQVVTTTTTVPQVVGFTQRVVGTTQTVTVDPTTGARVVTNTPIIVSDPVVVPGTVTHTQVIRAPVAGRYQGVMITDNDNPRPVDRVYFGYNFLSDLGASLNGGAGTDLQRQHVGFEKTFLDGDASFGMRLPFVEQYGQGISSRDVGDLTLVFKYAVYNDRQTGDLVSGGLLLTTPTGGGGVILADGSGTPHSWLFQPWGGFVKTLDRLYVMGVSNLIAPSDGRDPLLWGNSLAAGYWLYRSDSDRLLTGVIPTIEFHSRTPLNHRNPDDLVFVQDQMNITAGVHFRSPRAILSPAVCVPVMGPRPWSIEAMCFANWTF
jgi:hypothetical protein